MKHSDFLCKNYILNGLDNTLYNVYSSIKIARELWGIHGQKIQNGGCRNEEIRCGQIP